MLDYKEFIRNKSQLGKMSGFDPISIPDCLFDFQKHLVDWSLRKGRAAIFADTGLGKSLMQLTWADNVVRRTNKPVLLLTPLAVGQQTEAEAHKFGIEAARSRDGMVPSGARIIITNYENLKHFNWQHFDGVVCDESSILKNFEGAYKAQITEFMRLVPYRLLCTATAAPNDFIELGTSSECLGEMGYMDMLGRFFKNDQNSLHPSSGRGRFECGLQTQNKWRFRGHSVVDFWRWVCSWARAIRKPSDLGFDDSRFFLPEMTMIEHPIMPREARPGYLFSIPAKGLKEQNAERKHTIRERCEKAAQLVADTGESAVCWCELDKEGEVLRKSISGAVEVHGKMADEEKEEKLVAFARGEFRVLVTKKKIAGFGLNWQHCAHQTHFPTNSYEQFYQATKRSHRFGQKRPVRIDIVTSEGSAGELANLKRKGAQADLMFSKLVELMNDQLSINKETIYTKKAEAPKWLK